MEMTDLDYSGVVNRIQNNEIEGAQFLVEIAFEKEAVEEAIKSHEESLNVLRRTHERLNGAAHNVLLHLGKITPLAVKRDEFIVVVTSNNISIERNVL
jgi:aromatic ring-opening dioxygenase LigB subunit